MKTKDDMINDIIKVEGGYVNDPSDSGGETNFGITKAVARANGYEGNMRNLTKQQAFDIYERKYWYTPRFNDVCLTSPELAYELFDTGVNMGTGRAARFLQRSLNVLNNRGNLYPDIGVDGAVGRKTIQALKDFKGWAGL